MNMQAAETYKQEPYEVPEGGLASFLTATSGSWSDEALKGPDTEYTIHIADQLAKYGREEDTELAHVAPGETVVPLAVLDADPDLKNRLFAQMRDLGLEPERYVVGNELNSINPDTGRPEFFLKKIVKGIKKAVKGVVKVFKKLAPIILPIALNFMFPGLGAIASGALGSGIGTLVQGGSFKDAFKAALIGGAVGGLSSGIAGAVKGTGFIEGVKGGLPGGTFGGGAPSGPAPIETGVPDVIQDAMPATPPGAAESVAQAAAPAPTPGAMDMLQQSAVAGQDAAAQLGLPGGQLPQMPAHSPVAPAQYAQSTPVNPNAVQPMMQPATPGTAATAAESTTAADGTVSIDTTVPPPDLEPSFFDKTKDFLFRGGKSPADVQALKDAAFKNKYDEVLQRYLQGGATQSQAADAALKAAEAASASAGPGMLAKYGPSVALGMLGANAMGMFDAPKMDEPYNQWPYTSQELIDANPYAYHVAPLGVQVGPYGRAAQGGGVARDYPRMNGAIYGPGTETSDDVPAMLSDGEFVMTARAVRGAGGGDRKRGMQNMYRIMRDFERGASRG
jgi:hypothetical protein